MKTEICLALGSNLADREANLNFALDRLAAGGVRTIHASALYETEPVGYRDQGWFLNAAVRAETELIPKEVLGLIRSIEATLGRQRNIPNGPRTIDIDILFWGREVIQSEDLVVPHPRLQERLFVLFPLHDVAADWVHPQLGVSVRTLLGQLDTSEQVRVFKTSFYPVPQPLPLRP